MKELKFSVIVSSSYIDTSFTKILANKKAKLAKVTNNEEMVHKMHLMYFLYLFFFD